jgi:transcriptional regulator with XRE-family HTH domain
MRYYVRHDRASPRCRVDISRPIRHAVHVTGRENKRLAEAVIALRGQLNLTQQELADRAGLSLTTIIRVEGGKNMPRPQTFGAIDRVAGWESGSARALYLRGTPPVMAKEASNLRDDNERKLWALDLPADVRLGYIEQYRRLNPSARSGE